MLRIITPICPPDQPEVAAPNRAVKDPDLRARIDRINAREAWRTSRSNPESYKARMLRENPEVMF